jgi:RNA polymerase sigma-70 factor, ECF subfamily
MLNYFNRTKPPDLAIFEAQLAAHERRWYSACLRITKDVGLAEDALQEAMLKAWDKRAQFRAEANITTWIHQIAVRCALDQLRRHRNFGEKSILVLADQNEAIVELPDACADPIANGVNRQLGAQLDSALQQLSDLERVCFVLKHLEGYSLHELTQQLNTTLDSIKQALFRATRKLRVNLAHWQTEP